MIRKVMKFLYRDEINTLMMILSILPFFTNDWNYSIAVYGIFFSYFLIDFLINIKFKVYKQSRPLFITDLLSLLSLLPETRIFVLFRFFRVFRILLRIKELRFIINIYRKNWLIIKSLLYVSLVYMICVSLIIFNVEPQSFDYKYLNALYWSGITLTTVGYGDFYPVTMIGKLCAIVASFIGIAIVALPTGFVASEFLDRLGELKKIKQEDKKKK